MGKYHGAIADYTSALASVGGQDRSTLYMERGEVYERLGERLLAEEDFRLAAGQ
jgi:lipoprotein NlpI